MKTLTADEFQDRLKAVNRATRIFGELTGHNITRAFEAYQLILSEQEREIQISADLLRDKTGSEMDRYERPICDVCGNAMGFRVTPKNDEGINTQLVCMSGTCNNVLDSELTIEQWKEILSGHSKIYQKQTN